MDVRTGAEWLARVAVGGGSLLLLARVGMALTREPVRRQRLGEWGLAAALLLAVLSAWPAWITLPWPSPVGPERPPAASAPTTPDAGPASDEVAPAPIPDETAFVPRFGPEALPPVVTEAELRPAPEEPAVVAAPAQPLAPAAKVPVSSVLVGLYLTGVAILLAHRLLGHVALSRLLRRTRPAPPRVERVFGELPAPGRRPRLRVADGVRVPFSCGLLRPTVVLPAAFAGEAPAELLRWVLAHELAHVERHDALACLLLRMGQVVYYPLPWLWSLCRQVRLCQEYLADAAAVAGAGNAEDYAQFLLGWAAVPSPPAGVAGVSGRPSDLYRRITMLLQFPTPVERRCPRHWALLTGSGLVALAVLGAGIGRPAAAAPAPEPDKPRAEEPKKADPITGEKKESKHDAGNDGLPPDLLRELLVQSPDDDAMKALMEERERINQILRTLRGNVQVNPGAGAGGALAAPGMTVRLRAAGRLGVAVSTPDATLAEQLDLPEGRGLTVDKVATNSAAEKAGIKPRDILLELNGKPVPSEPGEFVKELAAVPADKPVDAVIMRRGKRETLKGLILPAAKETGPGLRTGFGVGGGRGVGAAPGMGMPGMGGLPGVPGMGMPGMAGLLGMPGGIGNLGGPGFGVAGGAGGFNLNPPVFAAAGNGVMTTTFRTDDRFTSRHQEGNLVITVTGKVQDGKAKVGEIQVQDGGESHKYDKLEKVPEAYRDKAKHLSDMVEKDGVRIQIKGGDDSK